MRLRSCYNLSAGAALILRLCCALEPLLYKSAGNPGSAAADHQPSNKMDNRIVPGYDAADNYEPETGQVGWREPTQEEAGQKVLGSSLVVGRQEAPIWTFWRGRVRLSLGSRSLASRSLGCPFLWFRLDDNSLLRRPGLGICLPLLTGWRLETWESRIVKRFQREQIMKIAVEVRLYIPLSAVAQWQSSCA